MSYTNSLVVPKIHEFAIGEQPGSTDTLIGVVERVGTPLVDVITGLAVNNGHASFTLSLQTGKASTGSITLNGQPTDGNTIVIDDGPNAPVTFEFDSNASVTETNTLRRVLIGTTLAGTMGNLVAAINAAPVLTVAASNAERGAGTARTTLRNELAGTTGNVTITAVGATIAVTGMSGGTGGAKNIRVNGADVANVVVTPGSRLIFLVEIAPSEVQDFYNFFAVPAAGTQQFGSLTLCYWFGELVARERIAY